MENLTFVEQRRYAVRRQPRIENINGIGGISGKSGAIKPKKFPINVLNVNRVNKTDDTDGMKVNHEINLSDGAASDALNSGKSVHSLLSNTSENTSVSSVNATVNSRKYIEIDYEEYLSSDSTSQEMKGAALDVDTDVNSEKNNIDDSNASTISSSSSVNYTGCGVCHFPHENEDHLLLCDADYKHEIHTYCLVPPLMRVPPEDAKWYCPCCDPVGSTCLLVTFMQVMQRRKEEELKRMSLIFNNTPDDTTTVGSSSTTNSTTDTNSRYASNQIDICMLYATWYESFIESRYDRILRLIDASSTINSGPGINTGACVPNLLSLLSPLIVQRTDGGEWCEVKCHWGMYGQDAVVKFPGYISSNTCFQRLFGLSSSSSSGSGTSSVRGTPLTAHELLVNTNDEQLIGKCVRIVGLLAHQPFSGVNSSGGEAQTQAQGLRRTHKRSSRGLTSTSNTTFITEPVCNEHIEINHCGRIIDRRLRVKMFVDRDWILDFDAETDRTDPYPCSTGCSDMDMNGNGNDVGEKGPTRMEFYEHLVYFNSGVDGRNCATELWINLDEVSCLVYASGLISTTPGPGGADIFDASNADNSPKEVMYHVLRSLSYMTDQYMKLYHKENGSTSSASAAKDVDAEAASESLHRSKRKEGAKKHDGNTNKKTTKKLPPQFQVQAHISSPLQMHLKQEDSDGTVCDPCRYYHHKSHEISPFVVIGSTHGCVDIDTHTNDVLDRSLHRNAVLEKKLDYIYALSLSRAEKMEQERCLVIQEILHRGGTKISHESWELRFHSGGTVKTGQNHCCYTVFGEVYDAIYNILASRKIYIKRLVSNIIDFMRSRFDIGTRDANCIDSIVKLIQHIENCDLIDVLYADTIESIEIQKFNEIFCTSDAPFAAIPAPFDSGIGTAVSIEPELLEAILTPPISSTSPPSNSTFFEAGRKTVRKFASVDIFEGLNDYYERLDRVDPAGAKMLLQRGNDGEVAVKVEKINRLSPTLDRMSADFSGNSTWAEKSVPKPRSCVGGKVSGISGTYTRKAFKRDLNSSGSESDTNYFEYGGGTKTRTKSKIVAGTGTKKPRLSRHVADSETDENSSVDVALNNKFECDYCTRAYSHARSLRSHLKVCKAASAITQEGEYTCDCGKTYPTLQGLGQHQVRWCKATNTPSGSDVDSSTSNCNIIESASRISKAGSSRVRARFLEEPQFDDMEVLYEDQTELEETPKSSSSNQMYTDTVTKSASDGQEAEFSNQVSLNTGTHLDSLNNTLTQQDGNESESQSLITAKKSSVVDMYTPYMKSSHIDSFRIGKRTRLPIAAPVNVSDSQLVPKKDAILSKPSFVKKFTSLKEKKEKTLFHAQLTEKERQQNASKYNALSRDRYARPGRESNHNNYASSNREKHLKSNVNDHDSHEWDVNAGGYRPIHPGEPREGIPSGNADSYYGSKMKQEGVKKHMDLAMSLPIAAGNAPSKLHSNTQEEISATEEKIQREKEKISLLDKLLAMEPISKFKEQRIISEQELDQLLNKLRILRELLVMATAPSQEASSSSEGPLILVNTTPAPKPAPPVLKLLQKVQQAKQRAQLTSTAGSVVDPRKKKKKLETNTEAVEPSINIAVSDYADQDLHPLSPNNSMAPSIAYNYDQYEPIYVGDSNSIANNTCQRQGYHESNSHKNYVDMEPKEIEVCNCCGRTNHITSHCPYTQHPDCNPYPHIPWAQSKKGRKWIRKQGPDILQPHMLLSGAPCRMKFPKKQDTKRHMVETAYTRMLKLRDEEQERNRRKRDQDFEQNRPNTLCTAANVSSEEVNVSWNINKESSPHLSDENIPKPDCTAFTLADEAEIFCNCCGRRGHPYESCPYYNHPDCNKIKAIPWEESHQGKRWLKLRRKHFLDPTMLVGGVPFDMETLSVVATDSKLQSKPITSTTDIIQIAIQCNTCGSKEHPTEECCNKSHPDCNNMHHILWEESLIGREWKKQRDLDALDPLIHLDGSLLGTKHPQLTSDSQSEPGEVVYQQPYVDLTYAPPICYRCGACGTHKSVNCPHRGRPDTNNNKLVSWKDSKQGKQWKLHGYDVFQAKIRLPRDIKERFDSEQASLDREETPYSNNFRSNRSKAIVYSANLWGEEMAEQGASVSQSDRSSRGPTSSSANGNDYDFVYNVPRGVDKTERQHYDQHSRATDQRYHNNEKYSREPSMSPVTDEAYSNIDSTASSVYKGGNSLRSITHIANSDMNSTTVRSTLDVQPVHDTANGGHSYSAPTTTRSWTNISTDTPTQSGNSITSITSCIANSVDARTDTNTNNAVSIIASHIQHADPVLKEVDDGTSNANAALDTVVNNITTASSHSGGNTNTNNAISIIASHIQHADPVLKKVDRGTNNANTASDVIANSITTGAVDSLSGDKPPARGAGRGVSILPAWMTESTSVVVPTTNIISTVTETAISAARTNSGEIVRTASNSSTNDNGDATNHTTTTSVSAAPVPPPVESATIASKEQINLSESKSSLIETIPPKAQCNRCGHDHAPSTCPFLRHPDVSKQVYISWEDSIKGRQWKEKGFAALVPTQRINGKRCKY